MFLYQSGSGLAPTLLQMIAANGYLFSFFVAFVVYVALMRSNFCGSPADKGYVTEQEDAEITDDESAASAT